MTQYPPEGQYPGQQPNPVPYGAPGSYAAAPAKPGSITTVAVLAIIIGSLGTLCCGAMNLVSSVIGSMNPNAARMPDGTILKTEPGVVAFQTAIAAADLVTCIALLVVGIGALSLRPWARSIGVMTSAAMLLVAVVFLVGTIAYTGPKTEEMFKQMEKSMANTPGQAAPPSFAKFASAGAIGMGIVLFILRIIVPVLILMLWTKPHIKAWFEGGGYPPTAAAGGYPQQQYPPQ